MPDINNFSETKYTLPSAFQDYLPSPHGQNRKEDMTSLNKWKMQASKHCAFTTKLGLLVIKNKVKWEECLSNYWKWGLGIKISHRRKFNKITKWKVQAVPQGYHCHLQNLLVEATLHHPESESSVISVSKSCITTTVPSTIIIIIIITVFSNR